MHFVYCNLSCKGVYYNYREEREVDKMIDRERFYNTAIANNCTINENTDTTLVVTSNNGKIRTSYFFDENGSFKDYRTEQI